MKNSSYVPYSQQEDQIIVDVVKNYPNNLSAGFETASTLLKDRTSQAISQRYYSKLRKDFDVIAVGSERGLCINTKNTPRLNDSIIVESAMILFNKMSKSEKMEFINKVF